MNLIPPNPEQLSLLQKLNNEDVTTRDHHLEAIKQWLREEPHLPDAFDDKALLNFLRWAKFSLSKAEKRIDMYFTVRNAYPEFFTNRDVTRPELQLDLENFAVATLPFLTPEGRRITVATFPTGDFCPEDTANFAKLQTMMADIRIHVEEGVHDVFVVDGSGVQLRNLPRVSISAMKKLLTCSLEAYPIRIKEVHVVYAPPLLGSLIKWLSRFVRAKIIRRIRIHDSLEGLHGCVPKEFLPEEMGGTAGKLGDFSRQWRVTMEEYGEWFKEDEKLKADETRRVGEEKADYNSMFGANGRFRQLMID